MNLDASFAHCRRVAFTKARNFYFSFLLLDQNRRDAMCAVYAFMRHSDDLSDEPGANPNSLESWREELEKALDGHYGSNPCWPAFHETVRRYRIPPEYFREMINGVSSDLNPRQFSTFDELYRYCYQVASVVGLTVVHIFGFSDPRALLLAEKCGIAFQLTNIIRDVREDRERGREYFPEEDRLRFPALRDLLEFEAERAKRYYSESRPLIEMVSPETRRSMWSLIEIYRRLLDRIERSGYDVMNRRIRLTTPEKLLILLQASLRRFESPGGV